MTVSNPELATHLISDAFLPCHPPSIVEATWDELDVPKAMRSSLPVTFRGQAIEGEFPLSSVIKAEGRTPSTFKRGLLLPNYI